MKDGLETIGSEWVVMINNLGCVTAMEMNILIYSFLKQFGLMKLKVVRLIHGPLMTALDMNGISITLLRVDGPKRDELLEYIDLKVDSPNWPTVLNLDENINPVVELNIHNYAA